MDNWKIIFSPAKPFEVYLAKNCLEAEGIETILHNELAGQLYGNAADKTTLLVREQDIAQGTKILIDSGYIKTDPE